jgi:hypothetical protein
MRATTARRRQQWQPPDYQVTLKDGTVIWHSKWLITCQHCHKETDKMYAYCSGQYCSPECYDTLFADCETHCMDALSNLHTRGLYHPAEQLCDSCYNTKHGLHVVSLTYSGWEADHPQNVAFRGRMRRS